MLLNLCCLTIRNQAPDIIVPDEPTNNLDIQNIKLLTAPGNQGTMLAMSAGEAFVGAVNVV